MYSALKTEREYQSRFFQSNIKAKFRDQPVLDNCLLYSRVGKFLDRVES